MRHHSLLLVFLLLVTAACGSPGTTAAPDAGDTAATADALGDASADTDDGTSVDTIGADGTADTSADATEDAAADTTPAKYATCIDVGNCVAQACAAASGAKGCEQPCLADAAPEALQKAVPLLSCYQAQCVEGICKNSTDPNCANDCIGQMCTGDLVACLDDGKAGAGVCGGALACFDGCDFAKAAPFTCLAGCYNSLDTANKAALGALGTCIGGAAQAGKDPGATCAKEFITCTSGGKVGDQGCYTLFGCQEKCKADQVPDELCLGQCVGTMTAKDQQLFFELVPCIGDDGKLDDPVCKQKFLACIAPSGSKGCVDTFACAEQCQAASGAKDSPACAFTCLHDATPAAADLFFQMSQCGDGGTGPGCFDALVQCASPAGTGTCQEVDGCLGACQAKNPQQDGPQCLFECLAKTEPKAAQAWSKLFQCKQGCAAGCQGDADPGACGTKCVNDKCAADQAACVPAS